MLTIPLFLLFLVTPAIFWFYGKRLLGSQTHPAALLILAWFASVLVLNFVDSLTASPGQLAFLWVIINFAVFAVVGKFRRKFKAKSEHKEIESEPGP